MAGEYTNGLDRDLMEGAQIFTKKSEPISFERNCYRFKAADRTSDKVAPVANASWST